MLYKKQQKVFGIKKKEIILVNILKEIIKTLHNSKLADLLHPPQFFSSSIFSNRVFILLMLFYQIMNESTLDSENSEKY